MLHGYERLEPGRSDQFLDQIDHQPFIDGYTLKPMKKTIQPDLNGSKTISMVDSSSGN